MSAAERWIYRFIALSLFGLMVLLAIFHIPTGG